MPGLTWTGPALRDLRAIDAYLRAEADPAVAVRMLRAIRAKAELLRAFSHAGRPVKDAGFRTLRVPHTPYLLTYRLKPGGAEIFRVYQERQDWRGAE